MTAALATLMFLASIWMVVVVAAHMLEAGGGKILAALKGQSPLATAQRLSVTPLRVSQRARLQRPLRARPELRAAA